MFLQLAHTKLNVNQFSQALALERSRFFEIARGSVIEIDAALGIAHQLSYATLEELQLTGDKITGTFKLLRGMITQNTE